MMRLATLLLLASAAGDDLLHVTVRPGALGVDFGSGFDVVGFGRAGEHHALAQAGVAVGDVLVAVDGARVAPPEREAKRRGAARRLKEALARLAAPAAERRTLSFRLLARPDAVEEKAVAVAEAPEERPTAPTEPPAPLAELEATPWLGSLEARARRGGPGSTFAAAAALAAFGAPPAECGARPFYYDEASRACDGRALAGAAGAYVVADRGGCPYAEKSYVAASAGALGLVVLDDEAAPRRLDGDAAFLARHGEASSIPVVAVPAADAAAVRDWARAVARRRASIRLQFSSHCVLDRHGAWVPRELHAARTEPADSSADARAARAADLVRRAFRPRASGVAADPKDRRADGAVLTLRGADGAVALRLSVLAPPPGVAVAGPRGGRVRAVDEPCDGLDDVEDALLVVAVREERGAWRTAGGCGVDDVAAAAAAARARLVVLAPAGGAGAGAAPPDPGSWVLEPRDASIVAVAAPAAAAALARTLADRGDLVLADVREAPGLLATWRDLVALEAPEAWPADAARRRRRHGALKRAVAPRGQDADGDQVAHLAASWRRAAAYYDRDEL